MNRKKVATAITIAGSDSGGGAGIQADIKTFSAQGVFGTSALTALTAQNTHGVKAIFEVSPSFVADQIDAVFEDIRVDAVKIGMLHRAEIIEVVADRLIHHRAKNIVLDPVMIAKGGASLLKSEAIATMKEKLLPLATLLTPNTPEAAALTGKLIESEADMEEVAFEILKLGAQAVLVKGGHMEGPESNDCFMSREAGPCWIRSPRTLTQNTHGTGCTLAAAITAFLARGETPKAAAEYAKKYLTKAIQEGSQYQIGHGHGPVAHHPFFRGGFKKFLSPCN